ncbi:MAG TPA: glycogen synthase [Frankiaceae bacterium]|jgi:starch synthase|nr:glycogen synthase [Frankiaceae bacterium]
MRVALLTREYPPDVYGGAGVHVEYLAAELARLVEVDVHCFGTRSPAGVREPGLPLVHGHPPISELAAANPAVGVLGVDLEIAAAVSGADVVHSHTWYANLAGHLAGLLHGVPHIATTHSLEPLRPWKAEQLGGGYALSSWSEGVGLQGADRVIAVSRGMAADIRQAYPEIDPARIEVIYNGIDTSTYQPDPETGVIEALGIARDRPYVVFLGRVTRQKGLSVLLEAATQFRPEAQVVLLAGPAETPELGAEIDSLMATLRNGRSGVFWIPEMLPRASVIQVLSHAAAFVCPSVYEPLGIVNLESMACATPVVASAVGGIPEVVQDGVTGLLVPPSEPKALAAAVNRLLDDPGLAAEMGRAGRRRASAEFSWQAIAEQTVALYEAVITSK